VPPSFISIEIVVRGWFVLTSFKPGAMVMVKDVNRGSKWEPVYEGSLEVAQQHDGGAYSLKNNLEKVLPRRFTVEMLKAVKHSSAEEEETYEVEKILDHRRDKSGMYEYLVKWRHYGIESNTWEPVSNFDSLGAIQKYWKQKRMEHKRGKHKKSESDTQNIDVPSERELCENQSGSDSQELRRSNRLKKKMGKTQSNTLDKSQVPRGKGAKF
jgi:hypothetical protein